MIGSELKSRRKLRGLTQQQAAAVMRVHRVTVGDWERLDDEVERRSAALWALFDRAPERQRAILLREAMAEARGEQ